MNVASGGLLGVAVGYSGWADRQMAGWKLPVGTAALGSGEQGKRYIRDVQKCRGVKNVTHYKTLINVIH